jgi:hypothetical protein
MPHNTTRVHRTTTSSRQAPTQIGGCARFELFTHGRRVSVGERHLGAAAPILPVMTARCVFCGAEEGLTNEDVLLRWLLRALDAVSVTGTVVYRQSKGQRGDASAAHSRHGKSLETKARAVCGRCNS